MARITSQRVPISCRIAAEGAVNQCYVWRPVVRIVVQATAFARFVPGEQTVGERHTASTRVANTATKACGICAESAVCKRWGALASVSTVIHPTARAFCQVANERTVDHSRAASIIAHPSAGYGRVLAECAVCQCGASVDCVHSSPESAGMHETVNGCYVPVECTVGDSRAAVPIGYAAAAFCRVFCECAINHSWITVTEVAHPSSVREGPVRIEAAVSYGRVTVLLIAHPAAIVYRQVSSKRAVGQRRVTVVVVVHPTAESRYVRLESAVD